MTTEATKKPDTTGSAFLRMGACPSLALILVAGLVGCAFGPSSGSLHFAGSDPMGAFSGDVSPGDCLGWFQEGSTHVGFGGTRKADLINVGDDGQHVTVSTHGGRWMLERSACRAFDVRKWFDAEKHLHVVVLVDCTSAEGVRVQGSVRSDACYIMRPR